MQIWIFLALACQIHGRPLSSPLNERHLVWWDRYFLDGGDDLTARIVRPRTIFTAPRFGSYYVCAEGYSLDFAGRCIEDGFLRRHLDEDSLREFEERARLQQLESFLRDIQDEIEADEIEEERLAQREKLEQQEQLERQKEQLKQHEEQLRQQEERLKQELEREEDSRLSVTKHRNDWDYYLFKNEIEKDPEEFRFVQVIGPRTKPVTAPTSTTPRSTTSRSTTSTTRSTTTTSTTPTASTTAMRRPATPSATTTTPTQKRLTVSERIQSILALTTTTPKPPSSTDKTKSGFSIWKWWF